MSIAPRKCLTSWNVCPGQPRRLGQIVHTESSGLTVGVPHIGHFFGGLGLAQPLALATLDERGDHLGDHVAGPRHDDLVALANVLARQILLVVEGRRRDRDAADVDRLQHRERQQAAGPTDVPHDPVELRRRGDRRELPRHRPPRLAPGDARARATAPRWSTLITTPSISKSSPSRRCSHHPQRSRPRRRPSRGPRMSPLTLKPRSRSHSSSSAWVRRSSPRCAPVP